jgi:hypothetical protein
LTENFLKSIKPSELGQIPSHPLDRCLDLFFLNTSELFTTVVTPQFSEDLLIQAALPYLPAGGNNHLLEIFEAAHSLALAVFAIPNNASVAAKHVPFYLDNLFAVSLNRYLLQNPILIKLRSFPKTSPVANSASPSKPSYKSPLPHPQSQTANPSSHQSFSKYSTTEP